MKINLSLLISETTNYDLKLKKIKKRSSNHDKDKRHRS